MAELKPNPIESMWHHFKMAVHRIQPDKLSTFSRRQLHAFRREKLVETRPKILTAGTAAKGGYDSGGEYFYAIEISCFIYKSLKDAR